MAGFGTPKHGGNFKSTPQGFKDGSTTIRILPPLHSCAVTGEYWMPYSQHFGYTLPNPMDGAKRIARPFECVEKVKWENRQKVVVQECPECNEIERQKARLDELRGEMTRSGKSEAQIKQALAQHIKWGEDHNRDFKWYANTKELSGEFCTRRLPSSVKKQIDAIIKTYCAEKTPAIDAVAADQGLWFVVTKTGKGKYSTEYSVKVLTAAKVIDGVAYETPKLAPLTSADAEAAEQQCYDLRDVGIPRLSVAAVQRLVDSRGDEDVVRSVFQASEKKAAPPSTSRASHPIDDDEPLVFQGDAPLSTPVAAPAPVVASPVEPPAPVVEDEMAMLLRRMAELKAEAAAAPQAVATSAPVTPPQRPVQQVVALDDEDAFMAQFE